MGGKRSGGHNRKPTAQKIAEGNRGKRALNEAEPIPAPGAPVMPLGMSRKAQEFWAYFLPIVQQMGVMTVADAIALGQLCMCMDRRMQAEEIIQKLSVLIPQKNELGVVIGLKMNPAVRVASDAERHIKSYLAAFGLDPSSRSGIASPKDDDKPKSALDAILRSKSASEDVVM